MANKEYVSIRESAELLSVTEKKVLDLLKDKTLQGYRIANQFLRLKRVDVIYLRDSQKINIEVKRYPYTFGERIYDFFLYNLFYMVCILLIIIFVYLTMR